MQKMKSGPNSTENSIMQTKKLPIYKFDNGSKVCDASLYNLYEVLKLLGVLTPADKNYETMCWVRDYDYGFPIRTVEQLEMLLLNDRTRLRISFFSNFLNNIDDLIISAKTGQLPIVSEDPGCLLKKTLYVYTIWFIAGPVHNTLCLSKSNIKNTAALFDQVQTMYVQYLRHLSPPGSPEPDILDCTFSTLHGSL